MPKLDARQSEVRLAIQKDGRLTQQTINMLNSCGLNFDTYRNRLLSPVSGFPAAILFSRDDDIPRFIANNNADIGIVGQNIIEEKGVGDGMIEVLPLGFGQCKLVLAVPSNAPIHSAQDLSGKRIATSYPNTVRRFFNEKNVPVEIIEIAGSVEITPALGVASAIADLTATGSSLLMHDLRRIEPPILESQAVLVASIAAWNDPARRELIDRLKLRVQSVLTARKFKYIMMNAPSAALDEIRNVVPGLRDPTVIPLSNPAWVAIHTVVEEDAFWDTIEKLHKLGASEILVTPIEKLVK